jgi:hypothetical protein
MTSDEERVLYALRAEFERQAQSGQATYHGVGVDGLDGVEGYFDFRKIAEAVLTALGR